MADPVQLLVSDAVSIFAGALFGQQWGIFLDGAPVVVADNVLSVEYRQQWALSDYPVEQGAFETYDKVQTPFDARVRFSSGGSPSNRQALLDSIAAIAGDYNFYDVATPEAIYPSCNITHYDYRRTSSNGMGLITVDVWLLEVRITTSQGLSSTKDPSSASQVNGGTPQATPATPTQAAQAPLIAGPAPGGPGSSR
jgi:hypothetical protein